MTQISGAPATTVRRSTCPSWCEVEHEDENGSMRYHEATTKPAAGVIVQTVTFDDHEGPRPTPYFLVDVEHQVPLTADELRAMADTLLAIADAAS